MDAPFPVYRPFANVDQSHSSMTVIKFVYDQLIQYRIEAGDTYREMAAGIASISKKQEITHNITSIAKAINIIVYGKHQREIRNKEAEEQSMRDLVKLQIKVAELIKEGFIKSYDALINYLRRIWDGEESTC